MEQVTNTYVVRTTAMDHEFGGIADLEVDSHGALRLLGADGGLVALFAAGYWRVVEVAE